MAKTRVQKLWDKIDELHAALYGNPHIEIEKARSILNEVEQLVIAARREEMRRKPSRRLGWYSMHHRTSKPSKIGSKTIVELGVGC